MISRFFFFLFNVGALEVTALETGLLTSSILVGGGTKWSFS